MSRWTAPDGRHLTITEDSPGIVHITTDALLGLLRLGGFTEVPDVQGEAIMVQGTTQVLRDEHGRCQECGTTPAEEHRTDCPHHGRRILGAGYEQRPYPGRAEERRG